MVKVLALTLVAEFGKCGCRLVFILVVSVNVEEGSVTGIKDGTRNGVKSVPRGKETERK